MRFHLVAVGRVRDPGLRAACENYRERISRYVRLEVHEVREAGRRAPDGPTTRRLEGRNILATLPPETRLVAVTRPGTAFDSERFAALLGRWREEARDVAFAVGGAWGLDAEVLAHAEMQLSLGPLTLAHELARAVLLEQLYRACTIRRGEPYHKGTQ